jgi:hypothetical protein
MTHAVDSPQPRLLPEKYQKSVTLWKTTWAALPAEIGDYRYGDPDDPHVALFAGVIAPYGPDQVLIGIEDVKCASRRIHLLLRRTSSISWA